MQREALEEAGNWLVRAERDLLIAVRALRGTPTLADHAVYHAQQASEKALKAFLAAHNRPFRKTHNLERLVVECQGSDSDFVDLIDEARTLNPYATQFRYPGGPLEPELVEAEQAIKLAREIVDFVSQRLHAIGLP